MFYVQGINIRDINGEIVGLIKGYGRISHVYYADGNNEYLVIYGDEIPTYRYKLPLISMDSPVYEEPEYLNIDNVEHMCYHKNRMIASKGNMLYFSGLQDPTDWTSVDNSREDRVPNCNQITGLVSFDDKLIVFSERNMHLYYGSNVISGQYDSYTCVSLDNNIGCYDQCTIKVHNSYLYWLYGRNIYEYDGSTIRNIAKPTSNNGVVGGVQRFIDGITINEAKEVSVAGSEDKVYFWFKAYHYFLIFDQRLRKWTKELQCEVESEMYYSNICDSYVDLNFSQTPQPIYGITQNGVIYEITGGRKDGMNYIKTYGKDEYAGDGGITNQIDVPFYIKTKEFKNGVLSKRKSLSEIWFNYDLNGTVNLTITADTGKSITKENILANGTNLTQCVMIPNEMQNVTSYTFEIYGTGDFTLYGMERIDRTHTR